MDHQREQNITATPTPMTEDSTLVGSEDKRDARWDRRSRLQENENPITARFERTRISSKTAPEDEDDVTMEAQRRCGKQIQKIVVCNNSSAELCHECVAKGREAVANKTWCEDCRRARRRDMIAKVTTKIESSPVATDQQHVGRPKEEPNAIAPEMTTSRASQEVDIGTISIITDTAEREEPIVAPQHYHEAKEVFDDICELTITKLRQKAIIAGIDELIVNSLSQKLALMKTIIVRGTGITMDGTCVVNAHNHEELTKNRLPALKKNHENLTLESYAMQGPWLNDADQQLK